MFIFQGSVLNNFLGQNAQQYRIPVYQRNYEWSLEQCKKLFDDIVQAAKRNQLHFCGSIAYQPMAPIKGINTSIVIDGQQRLTTIYILMKSLLDMAKNDAEKVSPQQALFNIDQFGQLNLDDTTKVKLKPAKDNNDQLLKLLYGKANEIDQNCEIYRNYRYFCELIAEQQEMGVTVADIYRGISLLTVAVIQLDVNDNAQEIFERINSTGVPLSLADKIRNYVLMTDVDQEHLYDEYWLKMEKMLPKEQISPFFLDYLNMKIDGFARENEAYEIFKTLYVNGRYSNESMLSELYHYAGFYHTFLYGDKKYGDEINGLLRDLQKIKQTTVFLFLFRVFDDYDNNVIDEKELAKVLRFLRNYSIRRLICEVSSNSLRGLYKTLYDRVFVNPDNKKHYYDAIVSFFNQLISKDSIPSDSEFTYALINNNLYRKNAICKYLLVSIENQGKEKVETENLTIEHVLPQNSNLSSGWQKMLGENWKEVRDKYLHTLGNLTLTAYNSEFSDKDFDEKKKKLADANSKVVVLYSSIKDCDVWNADSIENRAKVLSDEVKKLFPIEQPTTAITFSNPNYQEYSCENPGQATSKTPNYYIFQGEKVLANSFADILASVIDRLYAQDSSVIDEMARNDACLFSTAIYPMFSYNADKVKNGSRKRQINGTDIYRSVGFSAAEIILIIRTLLDKHGIERSEFVYSARHTIPVKDD